MMNQAPKAVARLTQDGGADGYVVVADNTPFWPGARVQLWGNTLPTLVCVVTDTPDTDKVGLRVLTDPNGGDGGTGRTDVSAYTVALASTIAQERQLVRFQPDGTKIGLV